MPVQSYFETLFSVFRLGKGSLRFKIKEKHKKGSIGNSFEDDENAIRKVKVCLMRRQFRARK